MKIGFLDRTQANWTAGASYTRSMVHALAEAADEECEVCVVGGRHSTMGLLPTNVGEIRSESDLPSLTEIKKLVEAHAIDVLLPITEALLPDTPGAMVGWIPDFQHRHLSEYFSSEELRQRDRYFGYLVENCDAMMFSSAAVLADFRAFYPNYVGLSARAHFSSSFAYTPDLVRDDPRVVIRKYGLPKGFVLVANQFWKHKNHRLVVEAVARARRARPEVHVVMVGVPADSRDPRQSHLSELFQRLSVEKLYQNISVLGEVPSSDLVDLLRCAIEVVQPSFFEGWNTTVEDALALGKKIACSDLATHREQAAGAFFFRVDDAAPLADHLEALDWSADGWAGADCESVSLAAERERGREWAAGLIGFCREVVKARRQSPGPRAGWTDYDPEEEIKRHPLVYLEHLQKRHDSLKKRVEELTASLQTVRGKAAEDRQRLDEKASMAERRAQALAEELWREKSRPLRARLADELRRRLGRTGRARKE